MLDYFIGFTGSSGNCVRIENMMFDIGINRNDELFQKMIKKVDAIFISHKHGDHLNIATYNWIRKHYPRIMVYSNEDVRNKIGLEGDTHNFTTVKDEDDVIVGNNTVHIFHTTHEKGTMTNAYTILTGDLDSVIFGTDFKDWNDLPDDKFDYFFLEANHDERYWELLKEIAFWKGNDVPYWIKSSTGRHTTRQDCHKYFETHKASDDAQLFELHRSSRFYDLGDLEQELKDLMDSESEVHVDVQDK